MIGKFSRFTYFNNLIKLDKKFDEILKDVEINKEESEYYGFSEENKNKFLQKFIKKNKNKHISFYVCAVAMFVMAIFILF